jgi:hypothetical protein
VQTQSKAAPTAAQAALTHANAPSSRAATKVAPANVEIESARDAQVQYQKIAALSDRLASDNQMIADFHARRAQTLQQAQPKAAGQPSAAKQR